MHGGIRKMPNISCRVNGYSMLENGLVQKRRGKTPVIDEKEWEWLLPVCRLAEEKLRNRMKADEIFWKISIDKTSAPFGVDTGGRLWLSLFRKDEQKTSMAERRRRLSVSLSQWSYAHSIRCKHITLHILSLLNNRLVALIPCVDKVKANVQWKGKHKCHNSAFEMNCQWMFPHICSKRLWEVLT